MPEPIAGNSNTPSALVCISRAALVPCEVNRTVTPLTTLPVWSVTVPEIEPVVCCAAAGRQNRVTNTQTAAHPAALFQSDMAHFLPKLTRPWANQIPVVFVRI